MFSIFLSTIIEICVYLSTQICKGVNKNQNTMLVYISIENDVYIHIHNKYLLLNNINNNMIIY